MPRHNNSVVRFYRKSQHFDFKAILFELREITAIQFSPSLRLHNCDGRKWLMRKEIDWIMIGDGYEGYIETDPGYYQQ